MIIMRGHHLRLLYSYLVAKKNPGSLEYKRQSIIRTALEDGHTIEHGQNILDTLEKALESGAMLKIIDSIDDMCPTCDKVEDRECVEFIPYGISAASDDRAVMHFYGLQRRAYTSAFIQKRLLELGPD